MPTVEVECGQLSYKTFGSGTPVVFIPPPVVGRMVFYRQVQHLRNLHQLILLDLRGHGRSSTSNRPLSYDVVIDDVLALLDQLQIDKAVVCGYSMCGSVVFEFLRRHPERAYGGISISGLPDAKGPRVQLELAAAALTAGSGGMTPLAWALSAANADNTAAWRYMAQSGQSASPDDVRTMFEYAQHFDCTDDLPHLPVPFKWVVGERDSRLQGHVETLRNRLPKQTIATIPGANHQLPAKQHSQLNREIVDFVAAF